MTTATVFVHGGAGSWPSSKQGMGLKGVEKAARRGLEVLTRHGSPVDAVVEAIVSMEDDPVFNAGTGSTLNLAGRIEDDSSLMEGQRLEGGGVAGVSGVKNPIRLARIVMEKTDHVLLAGGTAEKLARMYGLPRANLKVTDRVQAWKKGRLRLGQKKTISGLARNSRLYRSGMLAGLLDTVGALALDSVGNFAAGASTGGLSMKIPGRVGDSAILGAGVYADNRLGAATATGIGEFAIRLGISKATCDLMARLSAQFAAQEAISNSKHRIASGLGVITMDRRGRLGIAHSTKHLCWASASRDTVRTGLHGERI